MLLNPEGEEESVIINAAHNLNEYQQVVDPYTPGF
jgi:hypothetical protein